MNYFREIYRAKQLPVFQNLVYKTRNEALACPKGDVVLVQSLETGLIYNNSFMPELLEYGPAYQNEQSFSAVFQDHLEVVSNIISRNFKKLSLIEIGCGKGFFLECLEKKGFNIRGIDPAYEGFNANIMKEVFRPALGIKGDGLILRHVLEHINEPIAFLDSIRESNNGKGLIYIEVPCFDWICRQKAWFDIYYEHVNYFRLNDFYRLFTGIIESGHVFGGQYIFVVADLSSLQIPKYDCSDLVTIPDGFLSELDRHSLYLQENKRIKKKEKHAGIWGSASKGVIFSYFMQKAGVTFKTAIDINPAKQGKYMAASGLKILSPEVGLNLLEPGDDIFIMNSNYFDEIVLMSEGKFNYQVVDRIVND